jgi:uncharacterized membrane protein
MMSLPLVILIPLGILLLPILFALALTVAVVLLAAFIASGGFFFAVANEVAYGRLPAFMLLFALGVALVLIPLCLAIIFGIIRFFRRSAKSQPAKAKSVAATSTKSEKTEAADSKTSDPKPTAQTKSTAGAPKPASHHVLTAVACFGLACIVGSFIISALTHSPFWPAFRGSFMVQAADHREQTFLAGEVSQVVVRTHNEPIIVRADATATEITVRYAEITDRRTVALSLTDGVLTIREQTDYPWFNFTIYAEPTQIEVIVPTSQYVECSPIPICIMDSVDFAPGYDLTTDNGHITLNGLISGELTAFTSNGRVELTDVIASGITARTSNGRITLTALDAAVIRLTTSNGIIEGSFASAISAYQKDLRTSNGRITLNGERQGDRYTSETGQYILEATTSNGRIDFTFAK